MLLALIFAHLVDIHIPTSHDFAHEYEYERGKANREAEDTLDDPDASESEKDAALEQLFGPKGNRA